MIAAAIVAALLDREAHFADAITEAFGGDAFDLVARAAPRPKGGGDQQRQGRKRARERDASFTQQTLRAWRSACRACRRLGRGGKGRKGTHRRCAVVALRVIGRMVVPAGSGAA
jgi:hypothetical protein